MKVEGNVLKPVTIIRTIIGPHSLNGSGQARQVIGCRALVVSQRARLRRQPPVRLSVHVAPKRVKLAKHIHCQARGGAHAVRGQDGHPSLAASTEGAPISASNRAAHLDQLSPHRGQLDDVNETRLARAVDGADALARCLVVDVCHAAVLQDVPQHANVSLARCKLQRDSNRQASGAIANPTFSANVQRP
eukprot:6093931-Prymnesium_polylepis.1